MARKLKPANQLWEAYWASRSTKDRDRLIGFYLHIAQKSATALGQRLPRSIQFGELYSAAVEGLWQAVESFDAAEKVKFETFAVYRIRGAMMDWLRIQANRSRNVMVAIKALDRMSEAFYASNGRPQTPEEVIESASTQIHPLTIRRAMSAEGNALVSFSTIGARDSRRSLEDVTRHGRLPAVSDRSDHNVRLASMAEHLFLGLNDQQRTACRLYFVDGLRMREVGVAMNCSESNVSLLVKTALMFIRGRFTKAQVQELLS